MEQEGAVDLRLGDLPRIPVAPAYLPQLLGKPRLISSQKFGSSRAHPQLLGMQHQWVVVKPFFLGQQLQLTCC